MLIDHFYSSLKRLFFVTIPLFAFIALFLKIFSATPIEAQTSTTTFPVDEAGIAAYVKLDSVDISDLTEALNFYSSIEERGETYVIGTVGIPMQTRYTNWSNYPHVYIGLDGWVVVYYLNTEEASRMMQWTDYTAGSMTTTTLQEALEFICGEIGVTYSTPLKYYDFEYPDANRLTLIAETAGTYISAPRTNSFSVTIPGALYEASYILQMHSGYSFSSMTLLVDGETVFYRESQANKVDDFVNYGYYDPLTRLEPGIPHQVTFDCNNHWGGHAATVLIYKSD